MASRHKAYIALGANLGDPPAQLRAALRRIESSPGIALVAASDLYRTPPLGPPGQPDYCNAACLIETELAPEALLDRLQAIEAEAGRVRTAEQWGPRVLDLDLLHVEGVTRDTPRLKLPHPRLRERAFVLVPLAQIAPALEIPGQGRVVDLLRAVDPAGIGPWPDAGICVPRQDG